MNDWRTTHEKSVCLRYIRIFHTKKWVRKEYLYRGAAHNKKWLLREEKNLVQSKLWLWLQIQNLNMRSKSQIAILNSGLNDSTCKVIV